MRGVNKVTVMGHLGADPEVRYLPNGTAVANINVATSEKWKDKDSGEEREATEWHRIAFFGRLAEIAGEYLKKGAPVYVEGKLQTKKWTDDKGVDRWSTSIIARELQMLGTKGEGQKSDRPPRPPAEQEFDDDIPF